MKTEASCQINAPKERVFGVFSDLANLADHVTAITRVEILTPGGIGVGTRFKETRMMFGKEASEIMEITMFSPPGLLREEARSGGMHYISEWSFSETGGVTTVRIHFTGKAISPFGIIMSPVFSLMSGSMKKAFLTDMNELKEFIERDG